MRIFRWFVFYWNSFSAAIYASKGEWGWFLFAVIVSAMILFITEYDRRAGI